MVQGKKFIIAAVVLGIDKLLKLWATSHLTLYMPPKVIAPFMNLTLAYNEGAAFSFLSDAGGWQKHLFVGIGLGVSVIIAIWLMRLPRRANWLGTALGLILGGALGNVVDRLQYGYVIDFIQLHWHEYYWPVFNFADTAITLGAVMIVLSVLLPKHFH